MACAVPSGAQAQPKWELLPHSPTLPQSVALCGKKQAPRNWHWGGKQFRANSGWGLEA